MEVAFRKEQKWTIADFKGNIRGRAAAELKNICNKLIHEEKLYVIANLKNVEFLDSRGLGGLINCHQKIITAGGKFILMGLNEDIYDLLEMTAVDKLFKIVDSEAEVI